MMAEIEAGRILYQQRLFLFLHPQQRFRSLDFDDRLVTHALVTQKTVGGFTFMHATTRLRYTPHWRLAELVY